VFEEVLLAGGGERRIAVETRCGRPITNVIEAEPGDRERRLYDARRKKYGERWSNRKPACGGYNCFGMVFASRRTAILGAEDADAEIDDILGDDGYRPITEAEAGVGDLVLYKDMSIGLLHAARITHRGDLKALFALSKWDSTSGEDEHHIQHHCWTDAGFKVELRFWTDRPS